MRAAAERLGPARGATLGEAEREGLVLAFALFLGGDAPGRPAALTRTTVRQLATIAGLREPRARLGVRLLADAGVLADAGGGPLRVPAEAPAWDDQLTARLTDGVLRPAPAARVVRWDVVRERAGGSTRALAATAAFLDLLPVPTEWTGVSLAAVGAVARYAGRKVAEAVQRAVECGVIEERRERGSASLYRFAAAALHAPVAPNPVSVARAEPVVVARRDLSPPTGTAPVAGMQPVAGAATLMVGGVPFPLPPGARPQLEQDADGRYWYRVGGAHFGPVSFD